MFIGEQRYRERRIARTLNKIFTFPLPPLERPLAILNFFQFRLMRTARFIPRFRSICLIFASNAKRERRVKRGNEIAWPPNTWAAEEKRTPPVALGHKRNTVSAVCRYNDPLVEKVRV